MKYDNPIWTKEKLEVELKRIITAREFYEDGIKVCNHQELEVRKALRRFEK